MVISISVATTHLAKKAAAGVSYKAAVTCRGVRNARRAQIEVDGSLFGRLVLATCNHAPWSCRARMRPWRPAWSKASVPLGMGLSPPDGRGWQRGALPPLAFPSQPPPGAPWASSSCFSPRSWCLQARCLHFSSGLVINPDQSSAQNFAGDDICWRNVYFSGFQFMGGNGAPGGGTLAPQRPSCG